MAADAQREGGSKLVLSSDSLPPAHDYDPTTVPGWFSVAVSKFVRLLRKRKSARFALRLCSRTKSGAFHPHVHGLVVGITRAALEAIARASNLIAYLEPLREPQRAAHYLLSSHQAHSEDRACGRTFWVRVEVTP